MGEGPVRRRALLALLRRLRPLGRLPAWARYAATVALVLAAFALRLALEGVYAYPFITFFPAILLASVLFDRGSGVLATLLGAGIAFWFFVEPRHGAAFLVPSRLAALAMFVAVGVLAAALVEAVRAALDDLAEANRRLRAADAQKAVLLADINHRLKNSLHAIAGILATEGGRAGDPAVRRALEDAAGRLLVLARVHERLHLGADAGAQATAASSVEMRGFLGALCADLRPTLVGPRRSVALRVEAEEGIALAAARAVPAGLIVNELATNALRHAFPGGRAGAVRVGLRRVAGGRLALEVADDGIGAAAGAAAGDGTGARLVRALARQLGGAVERETAPGEGTRVTVRFPEAERAG